MSDVVGETDRSEKDSSEEKLWKDSVDVGAERDVVGERRCVPDTRSLRVDEGEGVGVRDGVFVRGCLALPILHKRRKITTTANEGQRAHCRRRNGTCLCTARLVELIDVLRRTTSWKKTDGRGIQTFSECYSRSK